MKVLVVRGDDFSACTFENLFLKEKGLELWAEAMEAESDLVFTETIRGYEETFEISAYWFDEVDEKFISLMRSLQDEDHAKAENWFILEE
jgi:hypothetical protein